MKFPIIELVDRYVIALLKFHKTQENREELDFYIDQLCSYDLKKIQTDLDQLYQVHSTIWSLESQLKSGREGELSLEEIGQRAITIRDWNRKRIALKNSIADALGCDIREIKRNHASQ
jgi:hypothetical protein